MILPKRAFNSPLIKYANFADGSNINLIKLIKPYKNGNSFAVYQTTKSPFYSNGLFKTMETANVKFNLMIKNNLYQTNLIELKILRNE